MSDVMLFGVLRMPYDMAMDGEIARRQFYDRAQQAADKAELLQTAGNAVIAAFEDLGRTNGLAATLAARAKCETTMVALKDALNA